MALPILLQRQAVDQVKESLLLVTPIAGEYFFDLKRRGVEPVLKSLKDVTPDSSPWVAVVGGDFSIDVGAPVNLGRKAERFDVVIQSILKPDPDRWRTYSVAELLVLFHGDVIKAIERNAMTFDCSLLRLVNGTTQVDPLGAYAYSEIVLTYELRGTLGS